MYRLNLYTRPAMCINTLYLLFVQADIYFTINITDNDTLVTESNSAPVSQLDKCCFNSVKFCCLMGLTHEPLAQELWFVVQGSCRSLKVLEFFFQIFKAWKVLENRHGLWKSLNLVWRSLKVLELDFLKLWQNKWLLSQMRFLGSNATEMHHRPGLHPGPCWGSLQRSPRPSSWIWGGRFACLCL